MVHDLGTVDLRSVDLSTWPTTDRRFRLTATRDGLLTAATGGEASGSPLLELLTTAPDGSLQVLGSGVGRLDHPVVVDREYFLDVHGGAAGRLDVANLVSLVGTNLAVHGTAADDAFQFTFASTLQLEVDGIAYEFSPETVTSLTIDGGLGANRAVLNGSAGDETISLSPGAGQMSDGQTTVRLAQMQEITVAGGGGRDVASLFDSTGNDEFRASPGESSMLGPGFANQVLNVATVHAYASSGGTDTAYLVDSPGSDLLVATATQSQLSGEGFFYRAKLFDRVNVSSEAGGWDRAYVRDDAGGKWIRTAGDAVCLVSPSDPNQVVCQASGFPDVQTNSPTGVEGPFGTPEPTFDLSSLSGPVFPERTIDIRSYGAVGDGTTVNTGAFARAIEACAELGGGRVVVPAGVWLTGPIHLKSHINLHLQAGAVVRFSTRPEDYLPLVLNRWAGIECYNYSSLVYAIDCTDVAITGQGQLDGQGETWWPWVPSGSRRAIG